jgi:hypothetical protein
VLPLGQIAVRNLTSAARLDWKAIDPTIFGSLFESGLDDKRRAEMASLFDAPDADSHAHRGCSIPRRQTAASASTTPTKRRS